MTGLLQIGLLMVSGEWLRRVFFQRTIDGFDYS